MCVTYAKLMLKLSDESRIKQIGSFQQKIFKPEMVTKLTNAVPEVSMYGKYGDSTKVLQTLYKNQNDENFEFTNEL